ncbi:hypothetical protein R4Q14_07300 [Brachyspira intermedia]
MINEQLITDEGSCQMIIDEFITNNYEKMNVKIRNNYQITNQ